jgi:hypothetical protein
VSRYRVLLCLCLIVVAALIGLFTWWAWPYVRYPALLRDEGAITSAIGDAAAAALILEGAHTNVFRSRQPPQTADFQGSRRLCTGAELRSGAALAGTCNLWRAVRSHACENRSFCAAMRFDASVLSDSALGKAVHLAVQRPCRALPDESTALPPPIVGPMRYALSVDRRLLKCGSRLEVRGQLRKTIEPATTISIEF